MRVLIAVDSEAPDLGAVDFAEDLLAPGTEVVLLSVQDPPTDATPLGAVGPLLVGGLEQPEASSFSQRAREALTAASVALGARTDLDTDTLLATGTAQQAIVDAARQEAVDLVVVGTRDPHRFERLFGGSVSRHVVEHAPCSVLVVRSPDDGTS